MHRPCFEFPIRTIFRMGGDVLRFHPDKDLLFTRQVPFRQPQNTSSKTYNWPAANGPMIISMQTSNNQHIIAPAQESRLSSRAHGKRKCTDQTRKQNTKGSVEEKTRKKSYTLRGSIPRILLKFQKLEIPASCREETLGRFKDLALKHQGQVYLSFWPRVLLTFCSDSYKFNIGLCGHKGTITKIILGYTGEKWAPCK